MLHEIVGRRELTKRNSSKNVYLEQVYCFIFLINAQKVLHA